MPKNSISSRYSGDDYFDGGLHQYDPFSSFQSKPQEVGQLIVSKKSLKVQKSSVATDLFKAGSIFSNIYNPLNFVKKLFPRSLMSEASIINKKALSQMYGIKGFYLGLGISQMNGSKEVFEELALKSTPRSDEIKDEGKGLTKQKVCIIPGGTGHLGREYTLEAIKKGYRVIVTTRNTEGLKDTEDLHFVKASHDQQCSPEFWKEFLGRYTDAESLVMINTVGHRFHRKARL